jgi:hypothetical protein
MTELIIERFRKNNTDPDSDPDRIPDPEEFVQYLIDEARRNRTHYLGKTAIDSTWGLYYKTFLRS